MVSPYGIVLTVHSFMRFFVLLLLVAVVVKALLGWTGKKNFDKSDNLLSLGLLIFTHLQLVIGLILYFMSPLVQFTSETMKNKETRYWTMEHLVTMLIAIALITVARISMKKMPTDEAKHKRLFIFNVIALVLIIGAIAMSARGILSPPQGL